LNANAVLTAALFMRATPSGNCSTPRCEILAKYFGVIRIDTASSDIIALQDTIAQRIVEGLRLN